MQTRETTLAMKKTVAMTNVAVTTANTAGPRFAKSPGVRAPCADIEDWGPQALDHGC